MSANLPPIARTAPTGRVVYNPVGGSTTIYSQDPGAVVTGGQTRKFAVAARHPAVQQALRLKLSGPFWVDWQIVGQNDLEEYPGFEQIENVAVEMIMEMLSGLDFQDFTACQSTSLTDAVVCGFGIGELFWHERNDRGRQKLKSIKFYAPWEFDLEWDEDFNLSKIRHLRSGATCPKPGGSPDELSKFLVLPWPTNAHGNAYGLSMMEPIFEDVQLIRVLERCQEEGVRSVALKALLHEYRGKDLNDAELDALKADLTALMSGSLISFEATEDKEGKFASLHKVSVLDSRADAEGLKLITEILDKLYKRVNRVLGLPDDLGFTTTTVGSLAKAEEEGTIYMQEIIAMQKWIEGWVNRLLIPLIMRYNFPTLMDGPFKYPRFAFNVVEEDVFAKMIEPVSKAVELGLISLDEARAQIGFDGPAPSRAEKTEDGVAPPGGAPADEPSNFKRSSKPLTQLELDFARVGRRKEESVKRYTWVAHLDEESCPTCKERNGSVGTRDEWDRRGRPRGLNASGNPATECRDNCRCKLEATL